MPFAYDLHWKDDGSFVEEAGPGDYDERIDILALVSFYLDGGDSEFEDLCLDISWVNKIVETFKHPIPDIQEIIQVLADSKYFSELDLSEAYNQLRLNDELSQLMTFTCSFGKVSMQVMPFGAVFASDIFQSRISDEFLEFLDLFLVIYIDNLIVHTSTMEEHLDALRKVVSVCRKANLHLRKSKCLFMVEKLRTLGSIVSHGKLSLIQ